MARRRRSSCTAWIFRKTRALTAGKTWKQILRLAQIKKPAGKRLGSEENIIECDSLVKIYKTDDVEVMALQGLELNIKYGELMAVIGKSGSGKSTLLNMIGGLERPTAGKLYVDGKDLFAMTDKELVEYRKHTVGFVWTKTPETFCHI